MIYFTEYASPVGNLTLAAESGALAGLWIEGQKYFLASLKEEPIRSDGEEIFSLTRRWLDRYFAGDRPDPRELPLAPVGSDFRKAVWEILLTIPYGETMTYGQISKLMAERLGREHMSSQAVGGAVGHNPISIIIPCHRVVGANGSLTGYAGGVGIKEKLLRLEGAMTENMFVPTKGTAI